jgi:hypothetical protein
MMDEVADPQGPAAPDGFSIFGHMLAMIADPKAFGLRMAELTRSLEAVADGEAKLAADRAAFDQHERTTRAELEAGRADLQKRREQVSADEGMLRHHERVVRERGEWFDAQQRASSDFQPPAGSTVTRDPAPREVLRSQRNAPDGTPFPGHTTVTCDSLIPYREKLPMPKPTPPRRTGRGRKVAA